MALTKAEMSEYLFDKLGLSKRDAKELVELIFRRDPSRSGKRRTGETLWFW